jgi:hypothetical protein
MLAPIVNFGLSYAFNERVHGREFIELWDYKALYLLIFVLDPHFRPSGKLTHVIATYGSKRGGSQLSHEMALGNL